MDAGKKLKQIFIIETILTIAFSMLFIAGIVIVAVNKNQIRIGGNELLANMLFYGLIVLCAASALMFVLSFIKHSKDFKAVKSGKFEEVVGTVLRFAKKSGCRFWTANKLHSNNSDIRF